MVAVKSSSTVSLFSNATLTVGRTGDARVERTVDPSKSELLISNADQFGSVEAIPLRTGSSDVVVREQSIRGAESGMQAKLAHYAKHSGTVQIDGKNAKVIGYESGIITVSSGGAERMINLFQSEKAIKFGAVSKPFVERKSPTMAFRLGNVEGKDALHLVGSISATADVSYRLTIANAADQDKIQAELQPRVAISNHTGADFSKMSLALKLNEPQQSFGGPRMAKARSFALESVASDVAEISEGEASGVLTMPIRSKSVDIAAGETKLLNFAAAVNGTPNAQMDFVPVTLSQKLSVDFDMSPGKIGKTQKSKQSPRSSFEMQGVKGLQPAGSYEIYDGKDRAGSTTTSRYTEKEAKLEIPGVTLQSIEVESKVTTLSASHGEWTAIDGGPALPRVRQPETQYERVTTEQMQQELELSSKSKHARKIDVSVSVGSFDRGVSGIEVKAGGQALPFEYDAEQGLISFRAPVPANGKSQVVVKLSGERTETRFGDE